jgi:hypothetical protein
LTSKNGCGGAVSAGVSERVENDRKNCGTNRRKKTTKKELIVEAMPGGDLICDRELLKLIVAWEKEQGIGPDLGGDEGRQNPARRL